MTEENLNGGYLINLPPIKLKLRRSTDGDVQVWDKLRDKYIVLTPEEFVRQHFVAWLINEFHYPASHISNEVTLQFNDMNRRADTIVFGKDGSPLIVVEYKAPSVNISQKVFDQIARYNSVFKAQYIAVSNGINHYYCKMNADSTYNFIPQLPSYSEVEFGFIEN